MPLIPSALTSLLESRWIVPEGGAFPEDVEESADWFAEAVSSWFANAMASGFPCATAQARKSQLSKQAMSALAAGTADTAGHQLALAVASYYSAQVFGAGVAGFPLMFSVGATRISAIFADLQAPRSRRALEIATACHMMASSTLVTFPSPLPPGPIT